MIARPENGPGERHQLSLVIPCWNVYEFVRPLVASITAALRILGSRIDQIEVVFVDDRSTDGTSELLSEAADGLKQLVTVKLLTHLTNRGLGETRVTGARAADGHYVWFIDPDDSIGSNSVDSVLQKVMTIGPNDALIVKTVRHVSATGKTLRIDQSKLNHQVSLRGRDYLRLVLQGYSPTVFWDKVLPREIVLPFMVGARFNEDIQSLVRALPKVERVSLVDATYIYRHRSGSLLSSTTLDKRLNSAEQLQDFWCALPESNDRALASAFAKNQCLRITHAVWATASDSSLQATDLRRAQEIAKNLTISQRDFMRNNGSLVEWFAFILLRTSAPAFLVATWVRRRLIRGA